MIHWLNYLCLTDWARPLLMGLEQTWCMGGAPSNFNGGNADGINLILYSQYPVIEVMQEQPK